MNDLLSIDSWLAVQSKLQGSRPPLTEQEREWMLTAVDGLRAYHGVLNAVEPRSSGTVTKLRG